LILANAHSEELSFKLGDASGISGWRLLVDTAEGVIEPETVPASDPLATVTLPGRALLLYQGVR
jgi:hypothetical protein